MKDCNQLSYDVVPACQTQAGVNGFPISYSVLDFSKVVIVVPGEWALLLVSEEPTFLYIKRRVASFPNTIKDAKATSFKK